MSIIFNLIPVFFLFFFLPFSVVAAVTAGEGFTVTDPGGKTGVIDPVATKLPVSITTTATLTNTIIQWVTGFFWALSVGFLIWAALKYIFAQGDPTKVASAKQMLVYAIIAGGIGILAFGIKTIVDNLLRGS